MLFNYNHLKKILNQFCNLPFKKGNIILFRGLRLDESDTCFRKELGRHWTFQHDQAFPYGGNGTREYYFIYYAEVPLESVDWELTREKTLGDFSYEKEVVLKFGSKIYLKRIDKIKDLNVFARDNKWVYPKEIESVYYDSECIV